MKNLTFKQGSLLNETELRMVSGGETLPESSSVWEGGCTPNPIVIFPQDQSPELP